MILPRVAVAVVVVVATAGCGNDVEGHRLECARASVVYDEDGRREPFEADAGWSANAELSTVALIEKRLVDEALSGRALPQELLAREALSLCPGERFADQPAIATCTGILLSPDVVVTSAHCIHGSLECERYAYAGSFRWDQQDHWGLLPERIRLCEEVVAYEPGGGETGPVDFAFIRLSEPMEGAPASPPVRIEPLVAGEGLVLAGHPSGLPMKLDEGVVVDPRHDERDYFGADLDSFAGNSGGPVFDRHGELVGMIDSGQVDYVQDEELGCNRVNVAEVDVGAGRYERIAYLSRVLERACDLGVEDACRLLDTAGATSASGPRSCGQD